MKKITLTISLALVLGCLLAISCFAYGSLGENPVPSGKTIGFYSDDFTTPYQGLKSIGVSSVYVAYTDGTELIVLYVKDYTLYNEFCSNASTAHSWYGAPELEFVEFYEMVLNSTDIYSNFGDFTLVTDSLITNANYNDILNDYSNQIYNLNTQNQLLSGQITSLEVEKNTLLERIDTLSDNVNQSYTRGYNDGLTDSNAISNGLNTIFSAPINVFGEVFNFEFLGFNFYTIIQVLFTILICSYFIKLFI